MHGDGVENARESRWVVRPAAFRSVCADGGGQSVSNLRLVPGTGGGGGKSGGGGGQPRVAVVVVTRRSSKLMNASINITARRPRWRIAYASRRVRSPAGGVMARRDTQTRPCGGRFESCPQRPARDNTSPTHDDRNNNIIPVCE